MFTIFSKNYLFVYNSEHYIRHLKAIRDTISSLVWESVIWLWIVACGVLWLVIEGILELLWFPNI